MTIYSNRINVIATSRSIPSLRLIVTNTQNVSTPEGLQVLATVPLTFEKYSLDFSKFAFYYNNNPVYSWVESVSNGSMNVWLKMPVSIPANTSITINAIPKLNIKTVFDNNYWGCAPTLTSQYGQYDNGANVFNYYTNFAGTNLPSGWTSYTNLGSVTINNGVLIKGSTSATAGENGIVYQISSGIGSPPYIVDYAPQQTTSQSGDSWAWNMTGLSICLGDSDGCPNCGNYLLADFEGGIQAQILTSYSGTITNGTLSTPSNNIFYGVFTQIITPSNYYTYYNYTQSTGQAINITLGNTSLPFIIMVGNNEATYAPNGQLVQWFRIRSYPPNGVMPSVTVSY